MSNLVWNARQEPQIEGPAPKRRRFNDIDHPETTSDSQPDHTTSYFFNPAQDYIDYATEGCYHDLGPTESSTEASKLDFQTSLVYDDVEGLPSQCCYGMLCRIPVRLGTGFRHFEPSNSVSVVLEDQHTLRCKSPNEDIVFKLEDPIQARILEDIEAVAEVECQLHCNAQVAIPPDGPGRRRRKKEFHPWFLNAILYGPPHFEEPVGDFLSKHQMYLQDPLGCDRRVPYRNPHILSPETGEILMTDSITYPLKDDDIERLEVGPDLLTQLMRDEIPIAETEAPDIVTTKLFSHQKQGLTFMLRREQGWQLNESSEDIWSRVGVGRSRNNVTGACQDDPPPSFQGGLLADEMGLGKTLSMISLIASSQACQYLSPPLMTSTRGSVAVKTTLLIVPPPLIQT